MRQLITAMLVLFFLQGCLDTKDKVSEAALKEYNLKLNKFLNKEVLDNNIVPLHPMADKLPNTYKYGGSYDLYQSNSTILVTLHFTDSNVSVHSRSLSTFGVSELTIKHLLKHDEEIKERIREALRTSL